MRYLAGSVNEGYFEGFLTYLQCRRKLSFRFCLKICCLRKNRLGSERDALASWVDIPRAVELKRSRLGGEGLDCDSSDWILVD